MSRGLCTPTNFMCKMREAHRSQDLLSQTRLQSAPCLHLPGMLLGCSAAARIVRSRAGWRINALVLAWDWLIATYSTLVQGRLTRTGMSSTAHAQSDNARPLQQRPLTPRACPAAPSDAQSRQQKGEWKQKLNLKNDSFVYRCADVYVCGGSKQYFYTFAMPVYSKDCPTINYFIFTRGVIIHNFSFSNFSIFLFRFFFSSNGIIMLF